MIIAHTDAGTLTYEPVGYIKQLLDTETPENREKIAAHIRERLTQVPRDLMRFSLRTQESIDSILHPEMEDNLEMR